MKDKGKKEKGGQATFFKLYKKEKRMKK